MRYRSEWWSCIWIPYFHSNPQQVSKAERKVDISTKSLTHFGIFQATEFETGLFSFFNSVLISYSSIIAPTSGFESILIYLRYFGHNIHLFRIFIEKKRQLADDPITAHCFEKWFNIFPKWIYLTRLLKPLICIFTILHLWKSSRCISEINFGLILSGNDRYKRKIMILNFIYWKSFHPVWYFIQNQTEKPKLIFIAHDSCDMSYE